jgi:PKD repeat protein
MIKFPKEFDSDENLFLVKDALKVPLGVDHLPNNTFIVADGDISRFPPSGIITLVDQCSAVHERAVSFHYDKRTSREFINLELMSNSVNSFKPKKLTIITMQVMADHREALKEAIIAIEKYLGAKHDKSNTIFARIKFLRSLLFAPKAWFEMDKIAGVVPFKVKFTFAGTNNGGSTMQYLWKFSDEELETTDTIVEKVFREAGKYTISLKVKNDYGEDEVTFRDVIDVRSQAPEIAMIEFKPQANQLFQPIQQGVPLKIRTPINQPINVTIAPKNELKYRTAAGELVNPSNNKVLDPVETYTWNLGDELMHNNSAQTKAMYNIGGLYDLVLRTDTKQGSYRITTYDNCIDVVEPVNLWLWNINGKTIHANEFGLLSETFKTALNSHTLSIDDSFITNDKERQEFWKNNGLAKVNELRSGESGLAYIFWASGRKNDDLSSSEKIEFLEYNAFFDSYVVKGATSRPWNWAALVSPNEVYFAFGSGAEQYPTLSVTNQKKTTLDLKSFTFSASDIQQQNYKTGAHELTRNLGVFNKNYDARYGHFSAHRTTWKGNVGYILRNKLLGENFSFVNLYKTEGTIGVPFQNMVKLPDLPGEHHKDGSLVSLVNGVYFFSDNGSAYCYNDSTNVWELVTPHNRIARGELNTVFAASDLENRAYINIDNLTNGFFKFNALDLSYTTLVHKPSGVQWLISVY